MTSKPAAERGDKYGVQTPERPATIRYVRYLAIAFALVSIIGALLWFANHQQLIDFLTRVNKEAKEPQKNYDPEAALSSLRKGALIQSALLGIVMAMLGMAVQRARSATIGRWGLVVVVVLLGSSGTFPISGLPTVMNVARVGTGLIGLAILVMLFLPKSAQYFRECKAAVAESMGLDAQAGMGGLFGRGAAARNAAARGAAGRGGARTPVSTRTSGPNLSKEPKAAVGRAKAKARSDEAAVARGADLARSRAKASKSRRTPQ